MSMLQCLPESETFGKVRYFETRRCFNTEQLRSFNQNQIKAKEFVSFDCCLFDLNEIKNPNSPVSAETQQIMAVIIRPGVDPDPLLSGKGFTFCGYDLVEACGCISAITDCGGSFHCVDYASLNEYGLLDTYTAAVLTQLALVEEDPNEAHAHCDIVEIWRKLL